MKEHGNTPVSWRVGGLAYCAQFRFRCGCQVIGPKPAINGSGFTGHPCVFPAVIPRDRYGALAFGFPE
jgi:hypothetical protein